MQAPAILRRENVDQALDVGHSGVGRRSAPPSCAALAQRGARRELRTAASAQRVDTHSLRCHLAQDRPLHRDEERQHADGRRSGHTTETAPASPRPHTADELTKGLHGSLPRLLRLPHARSAAGAPYRP
jgi:hypothetical protein